MSVRSPGSLAERRAGRFDAVRLVIAECSVDYAGRLTAHLPHGPPPAARQGRRIGARPLRRRLVQAAELDEPAVHARSPSRTPTPSAGVTQVWTVQHAKTDDRLRRPPPRGAARLDPRARRRPRPESRTASRRTCRSCSPSTSTTLGDGYTLVRREYPTAIGPVDLLVRDPGGASVAVEVKRRGEIDGVEQLTRYLDLLNRDPLLAPVSGVFAAQEIKPQAQGPGDRPRHPLRDARLRRPARPRHLRAPPLLAAGAANGMIGACDSA